MHHTWFWKQFEMSCQRYLDSITISCNNKSNGSSSLKAKEADSTDSSAFRSNKLRGSKLKLKLNDVTAINSGNAMFYKMSAIPSYDTFNITNVDVNESARKYPTNKKSARKAEEFAQRVDVRCNTPSSSSFGTSHDNVNKERNITKRKFESFVSHKENVFETISCGCGLNIGFIETGSNKMKKTVTDKRSNFIILDEDEKPAQRVDATNGSSVISNSHVDHVDQDDTRIELPNLVNVSDFEGDGDVDFSSDFKHNAPRYSSTPLPPQELAALASRGISNDTKPCSEASWTLEDSITSLISQSVVQDKNDQVELWLNNSAWKRDEAHGQVDNRQVYLRKCVRRRRSPFWKWQELFRGKLNSNKAVNLSGYEADDEDIVPSGRLMCAR
ncbi:hypothetical protein DMN91_012442 [Ooceraea biroi]|uniref:Uncharacterized protein n=1 Tax=Ooceraea biroi TaxID=2015173 RepID=A0A026WFT7_OOCBI|nr:uncharacterized protein LOC105279586 [Ooceraea biroi]EZA54917.1 hypothetical protein X777_05335 [Ooceraea biroi]RLU15448.1 hypothetical protein DMN91_012442 [Ooceraea biroi]